MLQLKNILELIILRPYKRILLGLATLIFCLFTSQIHLTAKAQMKTPVPQPSPALQETRLKISEVNVEGASQEFQILILKIVKIKPGSVIERSNLQEEIDRIFAMGLFSTVTANPIQTDKGMRVTFTVQVNPIISQVTLKSSDGRKILIPDKIVEEIFQLQQGKILNYLELQECVQKIVQWYKDNGYVLAQVSELPNVNDSGQVILIISEGIVESIRLKFFNEKSEEIDRPKDSLVGRSDVSLILNQIRTKPDVVVNNQQLERDLKILSALGLFDDVKISLDPGNNPGKAIINVNVIDIENELNFKLKLAKNIKDYSQEASIYKKLGNFYRNLKINLEDKSSPMSVNRLENLIAAIKYHRDALKIYQNLNDVPQIAIAFNNLAYLSNLIGDSQSYFIVENNQNAAKYFQQLNFSMLTAMAYYNIGSTYKESGEFEHSFEAFQKSIVILNNLQKNPDRFSSKSIFSSENLMNAEKSSLEFGWGLSSKTGALVSINYYIGGSVLQEGSLADTQLLQFMLSSQLASLYQHFGDYQQAIYTLKEVDEKLHKTPDIFKDTILNLRDKSQDKAANFKYWDKIYDSMLGITQIWISILYSDLGYVDLAKEHRDRSFIILRPSGQEFLSQSIKSSRTISDLSSLLPILGNYWDQYLLQHSQRYVESSNNIWSPESLNKLNLTLEKIVLRIVTGDPKLQKEWKIYSDWLILFKDYLIVENAERSNEINQSRQRYQELIARWQALPTLEIKEMIHFLSDLNNRSNVLKDDDFLMYSRASASPGIDITSFIEPIDNFIKAYISSAAGNAVLKSGNFNNALDQSKNTIQILLKSLEKIDRMTFFADMFKSQRTKILSEVISRIGKIYDVLNQYEQAIAYFNEILNYWVKQRNILLEANTHWEIAAIHQKNNNFEKAKKAIEAAINRIESVDAQQQNQMLPDRNSQTTVPYKSYLTLVEYLASKQNYYSFYINLLMQMHQQNPDTGYAELAFQASEQSHGKGLRAVLTQDQFNLYKPTQSSKSDSRKVFQLNPVSSIQAIQKQLLDENTTLLEYALADEQSYLWMITKNEFKTYILPSAKTIDIQARMAFNELKSAQTNYQTSLSIPQSKEADILIDNTQVLKNLSQILLEPIADQLYHNRLFIVGDQIVNYIPFSALPNPKNEKEPLLVNHEIINLSSASLQLGLRQDRIPKPSKTLAILADPLFDYADFRMQSSAKTDITKIPRLYNRLLGTRKEAEAISKIVPANQRLVKLDALASRKAAISPDLGHYRILHFATHGILDSQNPQRSGMVFSFIDEQDNLQRSLLSTPDTFNLKISADLVVLSGCTTALGKNVQGEGLVGLTSGLTYAGAKQVIAGLWTVDDEATAQLMTYFYQGMLKDRQSPSAALRSAQLRLFDSKKFKNPYYWSAFTVQGGRF